jgi:hypothetical protein
MAKPIHTLLTYFAIAAFTLSPLHAEETDNTPGIGVKEGTFTEIIQKNSESTDKVDGIEVEYCLWYNPKNWELLKENLNGVAEYSFKIDGGDAFAMIIPEDDITPLDEAPYIIFEGAKLSGVEDIKIIKMENHLVNGVEVLYLIWTGKIMDTEFTYIYNIYSGKKGTVQVVAYTLNDLFDDNKTSMNELLNGFCFPKKS